MDSSFLSEPGLSLFTGVAAVYLSVLWNQKEQPRRIAASKGSAADVSEKKKNAESSDEAVSSSSSKKCLYLDYNGTTPVYPVVRQAMMPYFEDQFGNPSSSHAYGRQPRQAVERARRQCLALLGNKGDDVDPTQIWFTGCGTEADNLAIQLALQSNAVNFPNGTKPHIVTSNVEHPAIEAYLQVLEYQRSEVEVTYVPVQWDGRVVAEDVIAAIRPGQTILVSLMLANNETGAVQPVAPVAEYCRANGILMHTDAAQAAGKISVALEDLGHPDMVTLVGHKIGAPKGIACLYVRQNCLEGEGGRALPPGGILLVGGGQEFGRRGGTENVPYIVAMGAAADLATRTLKDNAAHMESLRARLLQGLQDALGGEELVLPHGPTDPTERLPNTLSVGLAGVHSGNLLAAMADRLAASAGAACHSSGTGQISRVLQAMQIPEIYARGTIRLSVGPPTTVAEVERAIAILTRQTLLARQQAEVAKPPVSEKPKEKQAVVMRI